MCIILQKKRKNTFERFERKSDNTSRVSTYTYFNRIPFLTSTQISRRFVRSFWVDRVFAIGVLVDRGSQLDLNLKKGFFRKEVKRRKLRFWGLNIFVVPNSNLCEELQWEKATMPSARGTDQRRCRLLLKPIQKINIHCGETTARAIREQFSRF